jgi:hypothetical protein
MPDAVPEQPHDVEPNKKRWWWSWPVQTLAVLVWLSAFVARGAITNDWHKTFFQWYTALVIGPFSVFIVWYLARDWLRRRRK